MHCETLCQNQTQLVLFTPKDMREETRHTKFSQHFMNRWMTKECPQPECEATWHPSLISLSNVSFCVPILGSKNVTCLSDAPALRGFQRRTLTYSFLRGLAAPVIGKVRVLCYEFTGVTLAWEDGQWVEAHKDILAGCSPKTSTPTLMFQLNGSYTDVQKTIAKTANRSRFWLPKIRT